MTRKGEDGRKEGGRRRDVKRRGEASRDKRPARKRKGLHAGGGRRRKGLLVRGGRRREWRVDNAVWADVVRIRRLFARHLSALPLTTSST